MPRFTVINSRADADDDVAAVEEFSEENVTKVAGVT